MNTQVTARKDEAAPSAQVQAEPAPAPNGIWEWIDHAAVKRRIDAMSPAPATDAPPPGDDAGPLRAIAYYLPQFHPIAENDRWWGKGFTEWTNVTRAKPNFHRHYQPRLPADLGFYDLRLPEVMEQQAELARQYGLYGFCYYYYWFAGKRLLERPIEQMLANGRPALPFCLCWANENWTRRWTGDEQDVLMAQQHSDADDAAVIANMARFMRSDQYIRVNGRPLLIIYRPLLFPDFTRTAAIWRQYCLDEGIGDLYIAAMESFELSDVLDTGVHSLESLGFDASIEYPPFPASAKMYPPLALQDRLLNPDYLGRVSDYRDYAVNYATRESAKYKRFHGVMVSGDNTARKQNHSLCLDHASPGAFQAWLESAAQRTRARFRGDERLLFINAWNEWAEGNYLEPDQRFGHAYLQALAKGLRY